MDKIILVFYIGVGGMTRTRGNEMLDSAMKTIDRTTEGEDIIRFIMPTTGDSRVECINPKLVSEEDFEHAKKVLEYNERVMKEVMKRNLPK